MKLSSDRFSANVREALSNQKLQNALSKATVQITVSRDEAFAEYPEGDVLRDLARDIKERTLAALDQYLTELAEAVRGNGGTVHWAADAKEAQEIIVGLAHQYGASMAVKSKSMTTEEIALNEALQDAGVEPVETDLGEYIIQLAREAPSHILAPAIHKSREDVTELFVDKLGSPRLSRHEELAREARRHLREKFRCAEMGITGVNFAVAETGSIAIVENEGQRSTFDVSSPRPCCGDGNGKSHPRSRRSRGLSENSREKRHRAEDVELRFAHHRAEARGRRGRPGSVSSHRTRQRTLPFAGRSSTEGIALLHTVRSLPQRVPGVSPRRRSRLRLGLLRPDRCGHHAFFRWTSSSFRASVCFLVVRCLSRSMSGSYRYPSFAVGTAE